MLIKCLLNVHFLIETLLGFGQRLYIWIILGFGLDRCDVRFRIYIQKLIFRSCIHATAENRSGTTSIWSSSTFDFLREWLIVMKILMLDRGVTGYLNLDGQVVMWRATNTWRHLLTSKKGAFHHHLDTNLPFFDHPIPLCGDSYPWKWQK